MCSVQTKGVNQQPCYIQLTFYTCCTESADSNTVMLSTGIRRGIWALLT